MSDTDRKWLDRTFPNQRTYGSKLPEGRCRFCVTVRAARENAKTYYFNTWQEAKAEIKLALDAYFSLTVEVTRVASYYSSLWNKELFHPSLVAFIRTYKPEVEFHCFGGDGDPMRLVTESPYDGIRPLASVTKLLI